MKLIEDDTAHAFKRWIFGQATRENTLGDNLYPCLRRDLLLKAYLIAYRLPHFLTEHLCHAQCYLPGSEAAGLKHDDSALRPTAEHRQRQQRGLAGTRWGHNHGGMMLIQLTVEFLRNGGSRQLTVFLDNIHGWHRHRLLIIYIADFYSLLYIATKLLLLRVKNTTGDNY